MIDRINWHTCQGELDASLEEFKIFLNNMEDDFGHMVTCYFGKKTLEMNEWTAEKTYAVLNYIANMKLSLLPQ